MQQEQKEAIVDDRIEYTQYPKQFMYFDLGSSVRLNDSGNTSPESNQNIFAYDPQTRQVLPNKEGWEYGRTNVSYFFNKSFNWKGDVWNTPFDQLRFKPAKLDGQGNIVNKGEISVA